MTRHTMTELPHSAEAERAILGALLLEPMSIAQVRTRLELRDWHLDRHRKLFQAFLDVADTGATPDLLTVRAYLEQIGALEAIGGVSYLATLDLDLPDLGRLDEYVDIVRDRSLRRDFIAETQKRIAEALTTARPVGDLVAEVRESTDKLLGRASRVHWQGAGEVLDRLLACSPPSRKVRQRPSTASPRAISSGINSAPASCAAASTSSPAGPAWARPRSRST